MERFFDGDARVVERYVELAVLLNGLFHEGPDVALPAYIRSDVGGLATAGSDFSLNFLPKFFPAPAKTYLAAFGRKLQCGGAPDARGGTRYEHDLAFESAAGKVRCCKTVRGLRIRGTSDQGPGQSRNGHPQQRPAADLAVVSLWKGFR
jgi:hypothetical protein